MSLAVEVSRGEGMVTLRAEDRRIGGGYLHFVVGKADGREISANIA